MTLSTSDPVMGFTDLPFETFNFSRLEPVVRREIKELYRAYLEAIDFTDMSYEEDECVGLQLSREAICRIQSDCIRFYHEAISEIDKAPECTLAQAGHDFWFTRNGHGVGFWDGDWPEDIGERLTDIAKFFGEVNLYKGDDGFAHMT